MQYSIWKLIEFCDVGFALCDPYEKGHCSRVAEYAVAIAEGKGMSSDEIALVRYGAHLHDLGKILIPSSILLKSGKLNEVERHTMEHHVALGYKWIRPLNLGTVIEDIVLYHHERMDGKGYPVGLTGEKIPVGARIVCLADVFDALTSKRPYHGAVAPRVAIERMRSDVGHFDSSLLDIFSKVVFLENAK